VDNFAVLDGRQHTAAAVAALAGCFDYLSFSHGSLSFNI
jgi:hypothetical protein